MFHSDLRVINLAVFSRGSSFYVFKGLSRGIVVGSGVINYCWVSYLEGGKVTLVLGLPQKSVYPSTRTFVRGA